MPHKRAKRSIREQARTGRQLDLPPSQPTFPHTDIPKSMARVLNAEAVQNSWREKKRALDERDEEGEDGCERKKRKTVNGHAKTEIRIKHGESLRHFRRRVEDDMRPLVRSAMKNTTSISKQKNKQSLKDVEQLTNLCSSRRRQANSDSEVALVHQGKGDQNLDFVRVSSSMPKRLNDIVQAPPELKPAPRLKRLVQKTKTEKSGSMSRIGNDDGNAGVITQQQKRMMELEREKAINRYRSLKEAKLKEWQRDTGVSS